MLPTRILLADHALIRIGLRELLESQTNWTILAEAANGREAVARTLELKPDIVLLDIAMPLLSGLDACRQILSAVPKARVLILTMHDTDTIIKQVLAAGARGYILKSDAPRDLVAAVEAVRGGKTYFTPTRIEKGQAESVCLTNRQREVLQLIAEGHSNKEVSTILKITRKTAETHRANIMTRLNCHSVSALVRYAIRNEIIQP